MSGVVRVLLMSTLLGLGSFGVGMLPLGFTFSKSHLAKLSTLGTGLLLGAALGVIIPEGIETMYSPKTVTPHSPPTAKIALSLLTGFTFMLLVEQLSSHAHKHFVSSRSIPSISVNSSTPTGDTAEQDDISLDELERDQGPYKPATPTSIHQASKVYPLTLGLVMHALADGLALGVSSLDDGSSSGVNEELSFVVFLALIIHKAPTALALTTSLLSTSIPRSECRKHIAVFSASTPFGAIVSYCVFSLLRSGGTIAGKGLESTGMAMLFSGGTFLYVATVLQPVSRQGQTEGVSDMLRVALIVVGMFVPFAIGIIIGDDY